MSKPIYALCITMVGILFLTSCLSSDYDTNVTYYSDTAVSYFTLSTVNRYVHTTSSTGADSVYKKTLSTPVDFTIDQYGMAIYNTDSLYADCDLKHVLISVGTKNSGTAVVKSIVGDTLIYITSTDSLDFTVPRELRVYSNDGSSYRPYKVTINKHQTEPGQLRWQKMNSADYPKDSQRELLEGRVAEAGLQTFIGANDIEAFAYDTDGRLMVSLDAGLTWKPDSLDDDAALLPTSNFGFVSWTYSTTALIDEILLVGINERVDNACVVWRKLAEYAADSEPSRWTYFPVESYNVYCLPQAAHLSLVYYHGYVLAFSSDGHIYQSRDHGITWKTYSKFAYPDGIYSYVVDAVVDNDDYIWLLNRDNGEVWRGMLTEE